MNPSEHPTNVMEPGYSPSRLAQQIGRRMRELRLQRGMSRRDFGATLGVSTQQIQKYEIGKDTVPLHRLLALSSLYGVSPQTFWEHPDAAAAAANGAGPADNGTLQLVRAYKQIGNAKVRRRLLQLVRQMAGDDGESANS